VRLPVAVIHRHFEHIQRVVITAQQGVNFGQSAQRFRVLPSIFSLSSQFSAHHGVPEIFLSCGVDILIFPVED
jgi:hypothetical protein